MFFATLFFATLFFATLFFATLFFATLFFATLFFATLFFATLRRKRAQARAIGPDAPDPPRSGPIARKHNLARTGQSGLGGRFAAHGIGRGQRPDR